MILACRDRGGFALLVVLWLLVLLAAIGTWLLANAHTESALARNVVAAARAEALADAGVARAEFNMMNPDPQKRWPLDGTPTEIAFPDGSATVRLSDETEKINPNLASPQLIAAIFSVVGTDDAHASELGSAISSWVHAEPPGAQTGDATEAYRDAGLPYGPAHEPFQSFEQMLLVIGMTPHDLAAARPFLTIYTTSDRPDGVSASNEVKQALALAPANNTSQNGNTSATPDSQEANADNPPSDAGSGGAPKEVVVSIDVTARGKDGGAFVRHAVVRFDPDAKGYDVLDWQRLDAPP